MEEEMKLPSSLLITSEGFQKYVSGAWVVRKQLCLWGLFQMTVSRTADYNSTYFTLIMFHSTHYIKIKVLL